MSEITKKIEDLELENKFKGKALNFIVWAITFIPLMMFNGWCLSMLWLWWINPVVGIELSVIQCTGFMFVWNYLNSKADINSINTDKKYGYWATVIAAVIGKLLIVGLNYLVYMIIA